MLLPFLLGHDRPTDQHTNRQTDRPGHMKYNYTFGLQGIMFFLTKKISSPPPPTPPSVCGKLMRLGKF